VPAHPEAHYLLGALSLTVSCAPGPMQAVPHCTHQHISPQCCAANLKPRLFLPHPPCTTAQFFISLAPTPHLDGKHTIFGRVCSGMQVIKRMGNIQTDATDKPTTEVKIVRARPV